MSGKSRPAVKLQIKGYTVFLVRCADGSYYSGMCEDMDRKLSEINNRFEPYFMAHPELVPVTLVFREDQIPFKLAYAKHRYLRSLTKRLREKLIKTGQWPAGPRLKKIFEKIS